MSKHTPGPWRVVGGTEVRAGGTIVCNTADYRVPKPDHEAVALPDAALIAAAPDLLAALQALTAEYEPNLKTFALNAPRRAIWENARAAIARATGGLT
jgi:hypothetical protein